MGKNKKIKKGSEIKISVSINYYYDSKKTLRARFSPKKNKIKVQKVRKETIFFSFQGSEDIFLMNKESIENNINNIVIFK